MDVSFIPSSKSSFSLEETEGTSKNTRATVDPLEGKLKAAYFTSGSSKLFSSDCLTNLRPTAIFTHLPSALCLFTGINILLLYNIKAYT